MDAKPEERAGEGRELHELSIPRLHGCQLPGGEGGRAIEVLGGGHWSGSDTGVEWAVLALEWN